MKTCHKCEVTKDEADFYLSPKWRCKACVLLHGKERRARDPGYLARWRAKNPDAHKQWYQQNKEHKAKYFAKWREEHKETELLRIAKWSKENSHRVNALHAKRRATKVMATPVWANRFEIEAIYAEAARITSETGIRHEVDHIVPLHGGIVNGLHWEGNLQVLPKTENISKLNRRWPDMPC